MDIINTIGNVFLSQAEFWWLATLFLFGWVWTVKTDNVDTYAAAHINLLQDLKVDTDEVPILQNILGGSLFGTWSQSDANKGLATLVYDNLAGGAFGVGNTITGVTSGAVAKVMTDNGATSMTIGAVTGCFQDNEQIGNGAGVTADVDGDKSVGITNDPCNNDDTADWTQDGDSLIFDTGWYEFATSAINKYCYKGTLAFTKGKLYKIEIEMKDGTAAPTDLQIYFYDGAEQVGPDINTGGAFVKYTWTFECATTTAAGRAGIKAPTSLGGNDIEFRRFSCYEITPCCTGADALAWDGDEWTKDNTLDLYREHWDGGVNTKEGSLYALKCVPSAANDYINWRYDLYNLDEHLAQFLGRTVMVGLWVKTSAATHFRAHIYEQGGASIATDFHTGGGAWEWLEVPYTFGTTATWLYMQLRFEAAPNVDGSTIVYLSQPMFSYGIGNSDIIGEGNYSPKPQEWIYCDKFIPSNEYDNTTGWGNLAWTDLNLEADSDAMLPKGAKAIRVHAKALDSGSGALVDVHVHLRKNGTIGEDFSMCWGGRTNSVECHNSGMQPCNADGDVEIELAASGGATLDIVEFRYMGVQVT